MSCQLWCSVHVFVAGKSSDKERFLCEFTQKSSGIKRCCQCPLPDYTGKYSQGIILVKYTSCTWPKQNTNRTIHEYCIDSVAQLMNTLKAHHSLHCWERLYSHSPDTAQMTPDYWQLQLIWGSSTELECSTMGTGRAGLPPLARDCRVSSRQWAEDGSSTETTCCFFTRLLPSFQGQRWRSLTLVSWGQ